MPSELRLLDVVALTADLSEHALQRGQVDTIVKELAPSVFEIEFSDNEGRAYAFAAVEARHLLKLRHAPAPA